MYVLAEGLSFLSVITTQQIYVVSCSYSTLAAHSNLSHSERVQKCWGLVLPVWCGAYNNVL